MNIDTKQVSTKLSEYDVQRKLHNRLESVLPSDYIIKGEVRIYEKDKVIFKHTERRKQLYRIDLMIFRKLEYKYLPIIIIEVKRKAKRNNCNKQLRHYRKLDLPVVLCEGTKNIENTVKIINKLLSI